MSKFINIGNEIINTDYLAYVRILEPRDPFLINHPTVPEYSVIYCVKDSVTVKPIFKTYDEAKEWVDRLFKILVPSNQDTATSGKPEPVSFDIYKDQWVKAKLTLKSGRLRALNEGEVYMIKPYSSRCNTKCVAVRNCLLQGERRYYWKDVQFELAGQKKGE